MYHNIIRRIRFGGYYSWTVLPYLPPGAKWLRTTLLTLRREWLEERVKKMEGMLDPNDYPTEKGWPEGTEIEKDGHNGVLQTLIDADRKELEELTN